MKYVWIIALILLLVLLMPCSFYWSFHKKSHNERVVECLPSKVIGQLEEKYSITIPVSASNILAAESRVIDGATKFILKFQIDPNGFDSLITSFTRGINFEEYSETEDHRDADLSPIPSWFLTPIQSGQIGIYGSPYGVFSILVDKSDVYIYTVYIRGIY